MTWKSLAEWLELIGGSRQPSDPWNTRGVALARAAWWVLLILLTWAFAGRNTKFIYIDF